MTIRAIVRVCLATLLLATEAICAQSVAPGGGNRLLMTTYWADDIVALLDIEAPQGKEELWRIDVAKAAGCLKPYDVRLNKGGSLALVSCSGTNLVIAIDVPAQQVQYVIETGMAPRDLVLFDNDRRLLVANSGSDTVSVVDLVNRRKLYDVPVAVQPYGVAVTDGGKTALVTGWASGDLHILTLEAGSGTTRAVVDVGLLPYTVVAPPGSNSAFVAINADDKVVTVDLRTAKLERSIAVGRGPWSLASSMDGRRVLVTNNRSNSLSMIDVSTVGAAVAEPASFTAGSQHRGDGKVIERRPKNAAIGSGGSVAAFTELAGDQIVIVELPSGKIVRAIDGGKAPYGIEFLR